MNIKETKATYKYSSVKFFSWKCERFHQSLEPSQVSIYWVVAQAKLRFYLASSGLIRYLVKGLERKCLTSSPPLYKLFCERRRRRQKFFFKNFQYFFLLQRNFSSVRSFFRCKVFCCECGKEKFSHLGASVEEIFFKQFSSEVERVEKVLITSRSCHSSFDCFFHIEKVRENFKIYHFRSLWLRKFNEIKKFQLLFWRVLFNEELNERNENRNVENGKIISPSLGVARQFFMSFRLIPELLDLHSETVLEFV